MILSVLEINGTRMTLLALQGPVLSAHKKLFGEKLAEEEAERKVKGEAKKERHLVRPKLHSITIIPDKI